MMIDEDESEWRNAISKRLGQVEAKLDDVVINQSSIAVRVDDIEKEHLIIRESTVRLREDMIEMKRNMCTLMNQADRRALGCTIILVSIVFILYKALL
jgi:septation ring formation regulator EzrA